MADNHLTEFGEDKLMWMSGILTTTIKDSQSVGSVDNQPRGISYDGTNVPWSGLQADKLYLQSGLITSTLKTSITSPGTGTRNPSGCSWDGENTTSADLSVDKMFKTSGQFTSTVKDSISNNPPEANMEDYQYDGNRGDSLGCGYGDDKGFIFSGNITSTLKTSGTAGTNATGISVDTNGHTLLIGFNTDKVFYYSGQFTTTVKDSYATSSISGSNNPNGIDVDPHTDRVPAGGVDVTVNPSPLSIRCCGGCSSDRGSTAPVIAVDNYRTGLTHGLHRSEQNGIPSGAQHLHR